MNPTSSSIFRRRRPSSFVLASILLLHLACGSAWAAPLAPAEMADIAKEIYPPTGPGSAVLVARGEEVLLRGGYGLASMELGVPIEPDMVFRLGSITKQFTAIGILMLAEQGKLKLDQTVSELLPDYPKAQGDQLRVHHLLTHTGGVPSYTEVPEFWLAERKDQSHADMMAFFANKPLNFTPGERFEYSNSGYYILGMIIEKVSGQRYADFVEQHLFAPAGMKQSLYDDPTRLVPRRVAGHMQTEEGVVPAPYLSMSGPFAAGALASTVEDLRRWNMALLSGKLISKESLEKAWTPTKLNDGSISTYAFGWEVGDYEGRRMVHHNGGIHGFTSSMYFFPEDKLTIVVLTNGSSVDPSLLAQRLVMAAHGKKDALPKILDVDPATLAKYEGVYQINPGSRRAVRVEGNKLVTIRDEGAPFKAVPIGENKFLYEGQNDTFHFELDEAGQVKAMVLERWGEPKPEVSVRTNEKLPEPPKIVEVAAAELEKLVGRYELQPGFILAVRVEDGKLVTQATGQGPIGLEALSPTEFLAQRVGARLVFELENNKAKSLTLHQGGQVMPAPKLD